MSVRFLIVLFLFQQSIVSAASFEIDAWAFDRGNVGVFTETYRNGGPPIIANGGVDPNSAEFDVPFPVVAQYRFSIFVAQLQRRPLTVYFDDVNIGTVCNGQTTKSWNSSDAVWDTPIPLDVKSTGKHTVKIVAENGPFPHVAKLKFETDAAFPVGWKPDRSNARKIDDPRSDPNRKHPNAATPAPEAMKRAIDDLIATFGNEKYPDGPDFLIRLEEIKSKPDSDARTTQLEKLRFEALVTKNPWVDFETAICVRRNLKGPRLAFPTNFESNSSLPKNGYDDEIMLLDIKSPERPLVSVHKPARDTAITDLDLDFDAEKLMFSAVDANNRWNIAELIVDSGEWEVKNSENSPNEREQKSPHYPLSTIHSSLPEGIDFYDSCYLPDGRICVTSTAPMVGVPCVAGASHVANLFLLNPKDGNLRQLCFDQEHNWCPTVLNNGRILYTRWEYADIPHSNSRLLFHCNPDGTSQLEFYGSNSYWPTSAFFARPIPNHSSRVVCVVGGHHDHGRLGELVLLDPAISRYEADGAVQRIPGYGKKVEAIVADGLTRNSWPKFVHPFPLSDKYFLVAMKPTPNALLGIYLVDVFDNLTLIKELPGNALVEPIPLRKTKRPPIVPDKVDLSKDDALVYISDVLGGKGLEGIPPKTVKSLRVFTYHFSYHGVGGLLGAVGQDGPWDVRGVLGTVPVEEDGSVLFRAPANLPIAVQPLDEHGQAMQVMRSWMTAMPGELLQCNGCHEPQNTAPIQVSKLSKSLTKPPAEIVPWNKPKPDATSTLGKLNVRGFSFREEIQPILDKYCIACHDGEGEKTVKTAIVKDFPVGTALDGKPFPIDLRGNRMIVGWSSNISGSEWTGRGGKFTVGYDNLQRFVRRPGIESDYEMFVPMEYAANTTELVQILEEGHYGVRKIIDAESWDKLITWIDMNTPFHGNWIDIAGKSFAGIAKRRLELAQLYGTDGLDIEELAKTAKEPEMKRSAIPGPTLTENLIRGLRSASSPALVEIDSTAGQISQSLDLGDGMELQFVPIPTGSIDGRQIEKPFRMGTYEITNAQFRKFDPKHGSRHESRSGYQFGRRGYDVNADELPVVRVSLNKAKEFCRWLSRKSGKIVRLPSELEWEFACRAGISTPFWYGDFDTDFSPFANFGDKRLKEFVACTSYQNYTGVRIIENPNPFDDRYPKDERFDDGAFLQTTPGKYKPNPWGLYDMHGNVAEWTDSGAVRGGSWYDRPYRGTSSARRVYPSYQPVFDVGFRIVVE